VICNAPGSVSLKLILTALKGGEEWNKDDCEPAGSGLIPAFLAGNQHQQTDRPVSMRLDNREQPFQIVILNIARQALALPDEVAFWAHWVLRRTFVHHGQELIERPQSGHPTVDGGDGMSICLAMLDESIHIQHGDFCYRLGCPGKELLQIVGVVDVCAALRGFPPQPF